MAKATSRDEKRLSVIKALNQARSMELRAIMLYMSHHYNLDDMDYGEMAANLKLIAVDEMRHAEMFAERIKELDGEPTREPISKTDYEEDVGVIFSIDADLEDSVVEEYNKLMDVCRSNNDNASAKLLEGIIDDEQMHFNYFDNVREHIDNLGETYLARIAGTSSSSGIVYQGFTDRQGGGTTGA